jgi:hypothetical protein
MNSRRISVIWEYNANSEPSGGSVWVVPNDSNPLEYDDLNTCPNSVKLLGPFDFALSSELSKNVAMMLRGLGFDVTEHDFADD